MNILLDTHVLLWYISDDPALTPKAKQLIENEENEIYFSTISVWEIQIKKNLYPNFMKESINDLVADFIDVGFNPLPFFPKHVYQLDNLRIKNNKIVHKDPFDKALLAQAKSCKIKFLTHDHCFNNYNEDCLILF